MVLLPVSRARRATLGLFPFALALTTVALLTTVAAAQNPVVIDGPPAPVAPAVITRDSANRATVRAIKLSAPLTLDGVLDEEIYSREAPFDGMVQVAPDYGKPASERSDIWITYDQQNMYLSCRCWDSALPTNGS